jgi:large subunit ribosomal protein L10
MRPEKQFLLDDMKNRMDRSKGFILARYVKMDSNLSAQFRTSLYQSGSDFEVIRKTILVKAALSAGYAIEDFILDGHIGIIFADIDLLQTSKVVFKFKTENRDVLEIVGGRYEGRLYSAKDVEELSKLPSMDEMRAQFLSVLEAAPAHVLSVMEALLTSVGYCLDNKSKI